MWRRPRPCVSGRAVSISGPTTTGFARSSPVTRTFRRASDETRPPPSESRVGPSAPPPLTTSVVRRAQPARDPEVLVPPGQEEALLRFVAFVHRERVSPAALLAAGQPSADLRQTTDIEIKPLEIVPLDPAESSGT